MFARIPFGLLLFVVAKTALPLELGVMEIFLASLLVWPVRLLRLSQA
jgi:hypothetical protein